MRSAWQCLAAGLAALAPVQAQAPSAEAKRPNIVLILADDWGFTDVGAFGGEIATPHLDALALGGVRFANFHVAGSCSPTRAMLQTGVRSHRAGVGNMPETIPPQHRGRPGYATTIAPQALTLAQRLEAAGYYNVLVGKWHLGVDPADQPRARGYHRALALLQSGADNFENKPIHLLYNEVKWTEDSQPVALPAPFYSSTLIVDKTIAYLDDPARRGRPFYASINFLANHIPVQAPDADLARYAGRYREGWNALRQARARGAAARGLIAPEPAMVRMKSTADWASLTPAEQTQRAGAMAAHAAMASAMDREVGRLIAALKARGEYDNTIFVFLSDNGPEPSDPANLGTFERLNVETFYDLRVERQGRPGSLTVIGAGFASALAAPFRGYKFTASEGGLRVPLIVAWPGNPQLQAGRIARGFAHVTDIAPTLLALTGAAGAPTPARAEPITGKDLTPMLTGAAKAVRAPDEALGYELSGNAALFEGDYKLVKNLPPYGDGQWHLYDIVRDPGETTDLAAREPQRFAAMQAEYAAYAKADGVLAMPAGYSAPDQILAYATAELLVPRLLMLWPYMLGLALVGGAWLWRRRRTARRAAP
ncbi:MAG: sulfatase-like hydrolase/transferase [Erythrobacter sp.]|uniref:sulfatase-like hydrolase/transferase n=1 Tax=Erythrobacter sp. TaxID=1042 RepID=UPI0025D2F931|nr:sulfatase-like hydrolase/transferase [Erythrobacter sp.]MCM0001266.1 sulfatase-like hydrolase/transferase [Erythrobacter sp.]